MMLKLTVNFVQGVWLILHFLQLFLPFSHGLLLILGGESIVYNTRLVLKDLQLTRPPQWSVEELILLGYLVIVLFLFADNLLGMIIINELIFVCFRGYL